MIQELRLILGAHKRKIFIGFAALVLGMILGAVIAESGPTKHTTTLRYLFQEGLSVEGGPVDLSSADSVSLGTGQVATSELADDAVTFSKQSHVTIGADPAGTCTAGDIHIDTDETDDTECTTTADNSLCLCTATNTWTALENN